jgi:hypothetical protein
VLTLPCWFQLRPRSGGAAARQAPDQPKPSVAVGPGAGCACWPTRDPRTRVRTRFE